MELPSPTAYSKRRPKAPVLKGRVLDLGADEIPLYSGALHYWRIERRFWRRTLEAVRNLGLDTVETYIPWGVHEQADGTFDFGERHERLDVGAFLELVSELGMYAIVRPGPHINAELTYFGLPERVVHDPECQARSPRRNPVIQPFPPRMFPAPSYASRKYHEEVGRWFDAVGQVVGPHLWPRGAVVLTQVDNEGTFFFRNGPYDQDYHRDAIDRFRAFLEERYGTVAALNEAYRRVYSSFGDVPPPERFDAHEANELVPHLDWAAFHEHLIGDALARMRQRLHDAGVREVPTIHNIPLGETGLPVSIPSIARVVDLVGLDYYHPAREHRVVKRRTAYLAGTFDFAYSPELGVGAPPWFTPLSHHDSLTVAMTAAAYGLRGFNLYMAVDRDRWYGAPIDARGELRTEASAWRRWVQAMRRVRFHTLDRRAEVALVVPNEYRRLSRATHLFGGIASPSSVEAIGGTPVEGCSEEPLGFKGPVQILWWKAIARISDALTRAQIPYVFVDSDASKDRFEDFKVVFSPTFEFVDPTRWARLRDLRASGAHVVVGPAVPTLDERMLPFDAGTGHGFDVALFDTDADAQFKVEDWIVRFGIGRPYAAAPSLVETAGHEDEHGLRMLFVMNPTRDAINASVTLPHGCRFEDVITGQEFLAEHHLEIRMLPQSIRALEVIRSPEAASNTGAPIAPPAAEHAAKPTAAPAVEPEPADESAPTADAAKPEAAPRRAPERPRRATKRKRSPAQRSRRASTPARAPKPKRTTLGKASKASKPSKPTKPTKRTGARTKKGKRK